MILELNILNRVCFANNIFYTMASKGLAIIAGVGPGTVYVLALVHGSGDSNKLTNPAGCLDCPTLC